MERYDHKAIEKKWQDHWEAEGLYRAVDDDDRPTYYVLDMFPYPSGAGLHVGHPEGYTATDIVARRMRMAGYNVLHPMGWDAFGLPAENYAIKTQIHPDQSTRQNIENFRRQIKMLGFSYDWDREISTSAPDYYKWTQWWFAFLYRQGLAYRRHAPVNWCMQCHTVLANEQVHDGICYCGRDGRVEQKGMEQWFFRITDFIEDTEHNGRVTRGLLSGLDTIDWPESTKAAQRNWIGRSEGAEVDFRLEDGTVLTVFTTRPDTLFGATFMVLAPEHPAVAALTSPDQQAAVDAYVSQAKAKTELERQSEKDKTGAFTGGYAVNPVNGDRVPVWIADYVLMGYGTGAIMAVPGHDERDFAFARTFGLEIRRVVAPTADAAADAPLDEAFAEPGVAVHSGPLDGLATDRAKARMIEILEAEGSGRRKITYKLRDWLISRQRYWGAPIPVVYDADGHPGLVPDDQLPVLLPTDVDFMPGSGSPLVRSESFNDLPEGQRREADTMDTFVCSSWYFFRYCDPKNDTAFADPAKLKKWAPVDLYVGGAEHTVLHLLYARFFTKAAHRAGLIDFDEPFLKLRHQGMILAEDGQKMSKSRGNVVNPDDVVDQYGADAMRLYEMFMGPFADSKPWATTGIEGIHRFLQRLWRLFAKPMDGAMDKDFRHLLHKTIKKIEEDTDNFRFNTAVSQMMIFVNEAGNRESLPRDGMADFLRLIAPYVPHMAEELWHRLGHADSVHREPWPKWDPEAVVEDVIQLVVQVNGKLRDQISVARDIAKDEAIAAAKASEKAAKWIEGKTIVKEVFVPGKLVNIVVKG